MRLTSHLHLVDHAEFAHGLIDPPTLPNSIAKIDDEWENEERNGEFNVDYCVLAFPDPFESEPKSANGIVDPEIDVEQGIFEILGSIDVEVECVDAVDRDGATNFLFAFTSTLR